MRSFADGMAVFFSVFYSQQRSQATIYDGNLQIGHLFLHDRMLYLLIVEKIK